MELTFAANDRYEMMTRLLGTAEHPGDIEGLCVLLETIGKTMDEGRAHARMNSIYAMLEEILHRNFLQSRIALKVKNICLKRRRGWVSQVS
jgi:hypothetical protein